MSSRTRGRSLRPAPQRQRLEDGFDPGLPPRSSSVPPPAFTPDSEYYDCPFCEKRFSKNLQYFTTHLNSHLVSDASARPPPSLLHWINRSICSRCPRITPTPKSNKPPLCAECKKASPTDTRPAFDSHSQDPTTISSSPAEIEWPSLEFLSSYHPRIRDDIPSYLRVEWSMALTKSFQELRTAESDPDCERALSRHIMLFKYVLERPRRSRDKSLKIFRARLKDWYDHSITSPSFPTRLESLPENPNNAYSNARLCEKLVSLGRIGNAIDALICETSPISEASSEQLERLQQKHPPRRPTTVNLCGTSMEVDVEDVSISSDSIIASLHKFRKGSAPGPSGCSALHLSRAIEVDNEVVASNCSKALSALLTRFAKGSVPDKLRNFLTNAKLIGLSKKNGDLRPIAIGETIRRLIAKCLLSLHAPRISEFFAPRNQMGLCTPGGLESIIHSVRARLDSDGDRHDLVCLKVDLSNAFNAISRDYFLAEVERHFPSIAPFAHLCYDQESTLSLGSSTILSREGCQQGDPLGPFLFSLALQPIIDACGSIPGIEFNAWYLDDGCLIGTHSAILDAINLMESRGPERGMILNRGPGKSELFWPTLPKSCSLPSDIDRPSTLSLLGTDISHPPIVPSKLYKLTDQLRLVNPPTAFILLRDCIQASFTHFLRTTPPSKSSDWCAAADLLLRNCLESLMGTLLPAQHTPLQSIDLRLPSLVAPAAYYGSRVQFRHTIRLLNGWEPTLSLPEELSNISPDPKKQVQKVFFQALSTLQMESWRQAAPPQVSSYLDCINLESDWLRQLYRFKIPNDSFQILLQLRLGVPLFPADTICHSHPGSGTTVDVYGHHALGCVSRDRTLRHNMVRDRIFEEAQAAAYSPVLEQRLDLLGVQIRDRGEVRPADIWLPTSRHCLDVCIVKPRPQQNHPPAHDGYQGKLNKYKDVLDDSVKFIPLAFEYGGRVHPDSLSFLHTLSARSAPRKGVSVSSNTKWLLRHIHFTIDKGNAAMILAKLRALVPGPGRRPPLFNPLPSRPSINPSLDKKKKKK